MARRTLALYSDLPREWTFALLGLQHPPGSLAYDDKAELVERHRQRLIQAVLRHHTDTDSPGIGEAHSRFIELLEPSDWPRPGCDLAGAKPDCRTPLDVAEVWGLEWLAAQIRLDRRQAKNCRNFQLAPRIIDALAAIDFLIRLKSAAMGGNYAKDGIDKATGRPFKVNWAILEKAWSVLEAKLAKLNPLMLLPVLTVHAPATRKPTKRSKPRLIHSRDDARSAAPPPPAISAADEPSGGGPGDSAA